MRSVCFHKREGSGSSGGGAGGNSEACWMHPLCCIAPVPMDREGSFSSSSSSSSPSLSPPTAPRDSKTVPLPIVEEPQRALQKGSNDLPSSSNDPSKLLPFSGELLPEGKDNNSGLKCPDVVGVLYKWVNYGKRWRPRWFVLQDGVLSYYKVHGPHKIVLRPDIHKGSNIIGDKSQRLMKKLTHAHWRNHKAFGKLHLKVSTIQDSKSDDKKFYIFTGTKTLHLRAETRDDRAHWLDALQNAKELLPPGSTSSDLSLSLEEISISTEKLKSFLFNQGLSPEVIAESEKIMLSECFELKDQIKFVQQSRLGLLDRLRQLEAEKVELETTVIDESRIYVSGGNESRGHGGDKDWEVSGTESDESTEKPGGDVESDEDDEIYFDTKEGSYRRQSQADLSASFSDADYISVSSSPREEFGEHVGVEHIEFNYPRVKRRNGLPDPKEKEKGVSLWSLVKDNIGKDLTRICLPVFFNEPISSLQKCFEDLEYSYLLDRAYVWGMKGNSLMRILSVAAFAVSGYSSTEGRACKPFNPLLGETYEADYPDRGLRFLSEKVSHHPMIIACHCQGRGWKFWGDSTVKSKFWGRSIQLDPLGILTLEFDDGEVFQWSKVTTSIYNIILGKLYCDHYGAMRIQGNQELSCKLKFKEQSIIDRNPHQVQGFVHDTSGKKLATLFGKWDESLYFVNGDITTQPKSYDPMSEATLLWQCNRRPENPTRYNLTSFAITLNELTPGLKEKLPPTDSRLRPDQCHLEHGEYEEAFSEKLRLEQKQRQAQRLQETGWQPRWFCKEKDQESYRYVGGYWEARECGNWAACNDIFGPVMPPQVT